MLVEQFERRFLTLDDVLEMVVYLVSAARNVAGGKGEPASQLFLDSALRLISCILQEGDGSPQILHQLVEEITARRDLLSLDAGAYVESLDDVIRLIARDMLSRNKLEEQT